MKEKGCVFCEADKSENLIMKMEDHYVIMDKYPSSPGHVLVIPLDHYKNLLETPDSIIYSMMRTAKRIGILLKRMMDAEGIFIGTNVGAAAGQRIMHTHIHVIPRYGRNQIIKNSNTRSIRDALILKIQDHEGD